MLIGVSSLFAQFDRLRQTDNYFFALRVDGEFDYVLTRAMCRTEEGVPLAKAAAVQPEFEFHDVSGTLVLDSRVCKDPKRSRISLTLLIQRPF